MLTQESSRGVAGLTVTVYSIEQSGSRTRIGSTGSAEDGQFRIEYESPDEKKVWNLQLEVSVDRAEPTVLHLDAKPRMAAGAGEVWNVRIPMAALIAAGVLGSHASSSAAELPALGMFLARTIADTSYEAEIRDAVRARLDPLRDAVATLTRSFRTELIRRGRGGVVPPEMPVGAQLATLLQEGLTRTPVRRPRRGFVPVSAEQRAALEAATGSDGAIDASVIEPLLHGPERAGERTAVDLLAMSTRSPRSLDEVCAGQARGEPDGDDAGHATRLQDLADAVWNELQPTRVPAPARRSSAADVWRRIDGLDVTSGPSDAPALFDFQTLHVPFQDVWRDLVDHDAVDAAARLHGEIVRLGGRTTSDGAVDGIDRLRGEARFLAREAPAAMKPRHFTAGLLPGLTGLPDPMEDGGTRWVSALLDELERKLHEPYRFTVYGADETGAAINFGLVTTYRQVWQPLSYQAGKLVQTITLAPREERTYARTTTTAAKRRTETKEKFRNVTRSEDLSTQRAVRDIVATAEHRTGYEAEGSYGTVGGSVSSEDARTSSDTRQGFREAVRKAASEYETDRAVDVVFETSTQVISQDTGKLVNPNDELAVTFLFYQLQRRYHVSERLHRVTPVILVAQPVPSPHHINITWILQHDWILRRVLLDRSFATALDLVTGSLVGEESTVGMLRTNLDQQRAVVAALKDSLVTVHANSDVLFQAVQRAIRRAAGALEADATASDAVEQLIAWLTGGESDEARRGRLEAAREALDRAEANERSIAEQLQRELTSLTVMTDRWVAASRALLDKTVEVQRLRLHIKQNVLYYMQAVWDHEPPDQRYFRLHQVRVPVVDGRLRYRLVGDDTVAPVPPHWTVPVVVRAELDAALTGDSVPLGEIADLDRPLGYRGNYAIFALKESNVITRYMMVPFVDAVAGAHDPDHLANFTRSELEAHFCDLKGFMTPDELSRIRPGLDEAHRRVLADPRPLEEVIVVPTEALFIEALPADQPILEDYKLRHRAADAAKADAEAARVRLENLRRGARILAGELGDPDIEKVTVVSGAGNGIILPAGGDA